MRLLKISQMILLLIFCLWQLGFQHKQPLNKAIPPVIDKNTAVLLSLGDTVLLSRLLSLWLQNYDSQAGIPIYFHQLDYKKLIGWLELISNLDPYSDYPFLNASRVFSEVKDSERLGMLVEFIHKKYLESPQTRWRWQAEAVLLARHRLKNPTLAKTLAQDLSLVRDQEQVPYWVKDMQHIILAQMGEFEAAVMLVSAMLETGAITDTNEIRFLTEKLKSLKADLAAERADKSAKK